MYLCIYLHTYLCVCVAIYLYVYVSIYVTLCVSKRLCIIWLLINQLTYLSAYHVSIYDESILRLLHPDSG